MPAQQRRLFGFLGAEENPSNVSDAVDQQQQQRHHVVSPPPAQQDLQQQLLQQRYVREPGDRPAAASSSYCKVATWLNSNSNNSSKTSGPLLTRATSLLWCIGLGGVLGSRASSTTLHRRAAAAAATARPRAQQHVPQYVRSLASLPRLQSAKSFPTSHPLTQQQLEQTAGISSAVAAAAPSGAAVAGIAKGEGPTCPQNPAWAILLLQYPACPLASCPRCCVLEKVISNSHSDHAVITLMAWLGQPEQHEQHKWSSG
jgi:hypothetical protein